jgi:hypothetical protein
MAANVAVYLLKLIWKSRDRAAFTKYDGTRKFDSEMRTVMSCSE